MKNIVLLGAVALTLASCAPRYNPNSRKPDAELSCSDITNEIARANSARNEAANNRGLSGQNVAWAVFFLPGVVANEYTNDRVEKAADQRISTLNRLYSAKSCQK